MSYDTLIMMLIVLIVIASGIINVLDHILG